MAYRDQHPLIGRGVLRLSEDGRSPRGGVGHIVNIIRGPDSDFALVEYHDPEHGEPIGQRLVPLRELATPRWQIHRSVAEGCRIHGHNTPAEFVQ